MDETSGSVPIYDSRRGVQRRRVCYFYDPEIAKFAYPDEHPMAPYRLGLTHLLITGYRLTRKMEVVRPPMATFDEMAVYHTRGYLEYLRAHNNRGGATLPAVVKHQQHVTRRTRGQAPAVPSADRFGDCPLFDGVYDFSSLSTGGSLMAATKLCEDRHDVTINWGGGLHHALRDNASGFCYVNDAVLAIVRLLTTFRRVLYIDVDLHHGDGVERAFQDTDRVVTLSFHKYGKDFFPYTGDVTDVGEGAGKFYALNVPLLDGICNAAYLRMFKRITSCVVERYQPEVIVLQCGADSLSGDLMDAFNLTTRGHGECVSHVLSFCLPLLLLGGGGYTPPNVARCWAHETALALGKELDDDLPMLSLLAEGEKLTYMFGTPFKLHIKADPKMKDLNSPEYLESVMTQTQKNLMQMPHAPGINMPSTQHMMEMSSEVEAMEQDDDDDVRLPQSLRDTMVEADNDF